MCDVVAGLGMVAGVNFLLGQWLDLPWTTAVREAWQALEANHPVLFGAALLSLFVMAFFVPNIIIQRLLTLGAAMLPEGLMAFADDPTSAELGDQPVKVGVTLGT